MSDFYRFLRPVQFNTERSTIEALPRGGICIHARPLKVFEADRRMYAGFSICHVNDLFNRSVAKKKAEHFDWYICPQSFSTIDIVDELLNSPMQATAFLAGLDPEEYLFEYLDEFRSMVRWIESTKTQAKQFEKDHIDAVKALQLRNRYHDIQS